MINFQIIQQKRLNQRCIHIYVSLQQINQNKMLKKINLWCNLPTEKNPGKARIVRKSEFHFHFHFRIDIYQENRKQTNKAYDDFWYCFAVSIPKHEWSNKNKTNYNSANWHVKKYVKKNINYIQRTTVPVSAEKDISIILAKKQNTSVSNATFS